MVEMLFKICIRFQDSVLVKRINLIATSYQQRRLRENLYLFSKQAFLMVLFGVQRLIKFFLQWKGA